jgi:hypothetical protein
MRQIWGALYGSLFGISLLIVTGAICGGIYRIAPCYCGASDPSDANAVLAGIMWGIFAFGSTHFVDAAVGGAVVSSILAQFLPERTVAWFKSLVRPSKPVLECPDP